MGFDLTLSPLVQNFKGEFWYCFRKNRLPFLVQLAIGIQQNPELPPIPILDPEYLMGTYDLLPTESILKTAGNKGSLIEAMETAVEPMFSLLWRRQVYEDPELLNLESANLHQKILLLKRVTEKSGIAALANYDISLETEFCLYNAVIPSLR